MNSQSPHGSVFSARTAEQVPLDLTGPGTPLYTILSDVTVAYAGFPAFIYLTLSPEGGKGVDDHDRIAKISAREQVRLEDILIRLIDTLDLTIGIVFAGDERPVVAQSLRELHRHIEGHLSSGQRYHAWERDLWAWSWAGIIKPIMDVREQLRGFESEQFKQDAYTGFLQIGALIGVKGLPDTYDEFTVYWDQTWLPYIDTEHAQAPHFLLKQSLDPSPPRLAPWLPRAVYLALSWPVRHFLRTSLLMIIPPEIERALGISRSRLDELSIRAQRRFWRIVPPVLTSRGGEAFFWARLKFGNPTWRHGRHYSPESLAEYRNDVKAARQNNRADPPRPSTRGLPPRPQSTS
ncbi:oxygenase MpaB family protein [Mycobacterium sp. NPDC050853]|uniref:oxygenase MpaB family protein n=1 Tax=Mycobacterium sp. NPDC050853 TaxID=3155160 RepID=UPI00340BFD42